MKKFIKRFLVFVVLISITLFAIDMYNSGKKYWFQGSNEIRVELKSISNSLNQKSELFQGIIARMPGMTSAEIIEKGDDFVTIKTNEGIMKRTNIKTDISSEKIIVTFDEEYQAGKTIKTSSHFQHEYINKPDGVAHNLTISNLKASGVAGFFYRNFGSSNIGKAFLKSHKDHFEGLD